MYYVEKAALIQQFLGGLSYNMQLIKEEFQLRALGKQI